MRWYLVAWDCDRGDWRTFRIDRMVAKPEVGAHFSPRPGPDGGDLKAYVSRSINAAPHADQARVVLHAPYAEMAQRISQSAGVVTALADGQRCQLECAASDSLVFWLLALDVDFEVLAPASLKERLRVAGARALRCTTAAGS